MHRSTLAGTLPLAVDPRTRTNPIRAMVICLVGAALTVVVPFLEHPQLYVWVGLMAACFIVPLWRDWTRGNLDVFEPIHVVGFIYILYFGLGAIWTVRDPSNVAYDRYIVPYIPTAALYCLIGYVALLAGYYGPWSARSAPRTVEEWPRQGQFLTVVGGLGIVGYFAFALQERTDEALLSAFVKSASQLTPLFIFAWALGWMLFFSNRSTRSHRLFLFGAMLPTVLCVCYLTVSNKSLITTLGGIPLLARWYVKRKLPWIPLLALLLALIFVIFPLYNTYRVWGRGVATHSERINRSYETVTGWDSEKYFDSSIGVFKRRMALINSCAIIIRDVGRWVPYAKGETIFRPAVTIVIPRMLWPNKPSLTATREFGRKFRIRGSGLGHIAASVPGELYWNFGLPGIIVGMGLWGVFMGWCYRRFGASPGLDPVGKAVHITILVQFAFMGGTIAPEVVKLVQVLVLLAVLRWVARQYGLVERRDVSALASPAAA